ncbi:MAG: hypothetical protein J5674_00055 [Candidatus Methanomethylophilaceae archaeon]|nr:hypothetical protein [Candidatus Methanomethylophilaceae archaeon]
MGFEHEGARDPRRDGMAKTLLSDARCLAYIVRDAVRESEGMSLEEVMSRLGASGGGRVRMLSGEVITGYGSVTCNLVFPFEMPGGQEAVIDVEIQCDVPVWTAKRQMMYLSGLAWYWNHNPAKDYSSVRPVYSIWVFLNPKAADRNRAYVLDMQRGGSKVPMTLVELHIGDPEGATCKSLRMLDLLFKKGDDPRSNLERVATEFNIDWTDEKGRRDAMDMLEAIAAEYRRGLLDSAREDGFIEGEEKGTGYMRAVMIRNYACTVRKALSCGMDMDGAMSLVPDDIAEEVLERLREQSSGS